MGSDITVVIPAYNAGQFIESTLRSVLAQSLRPDEIIVVDDASLDDTVAKVKQFGSEVRLIRCRQNNRSCGATRNIGIEAARTRYVAPFDADDLMLPDKLLWQRLSIRAVPDAGLYFTDFAWLTDPESAHTPQSRIHTGFRQYLNRLRQHVYSLPQSCALKCLLRDNFVGASTVVFKRAHWKEIGGYATRPELLGVEDLDFPLRMASRYHFAYVDQVLYYYRVHKGSLSHNRLNNIRAAVAVLEPYLSIAHGETRCGLAHQLGEMQIDPAWHSIEALRFVAAAGHWWQALRYGALRRHQRMLSMKLALHATLNLPRALLRRDPVAMRAIE